MRTLQFRAGSLLQVVATLLPLVLGTTWVGKISAQALNPISVLDASVDPGNALRVSVTTVGGTGTLSVDLYLVTPSSTYNPNAGTRFSQPANSIRTHLLPIPSFCGAQASGWRILAELTANGNQNISNTFSINFQPAKLLFNTVSGSQRIILSSTQGGSNKTSFQWGESVHVRAIIGNSGCLAQTQPHSIRYELDGNLLFGPDQLPAVSSSQIIDFQGVYPAISASGLAVGNHTITLRIGGGSQLGTPTVVSQSFSVIDPRADLVLTATRVFTDEISVFIGQPAARAIRGDERIKFEVALRNNGLIAAGSAQVEVTFQRIVPSGPPETVALSLAGSLSAGSQVSTGEIVLGTDFPGQYRISFRADPNSLVSESNEANNIGIIEFEILDGDLDGDGIPNSWEITKGFNEDDPLDKDNDVDGDSTPNWMEFMAGLDPRSYAESVSAPFQADGSLILSIAIPGVRYIVKEYVSGQWTELPTTAFSVTSLVHNRPVAIPSSVSASRICCLSYTKL